MIESRRNRMWPMMIRFLLPALIACAPLSAQSFGGAKMYAEQNNKLKLVRVSIDVQDAALVATIGGKDGKIVEIPYAGITAMEYERSAHRRWKTAVLLSPLFLLSKGKKHWFALIQDDEETVFQLSKSNYGEVLNAIESKTGQKVKMIASRG